MGIKNTWVVSFAVLILPINIGWAATGSESASFLDIPVGGRPAAMGGAYGALAVDAYAPLFNPAGLGFLPSTQLAAMHLNSIGSVAYESASFAYPISQGHALGLSAQYLRPGDTPSRDINGNEIGDFSGSFLAASAGYGRRITHDFSLGLVGKTVQSKIAGYSASAYAVDFGGLVQATPQLSLSAVVANVGNSVKFVDQADPLPMSFRLGGAYVFIENVTVALQGAYARSGLAGAQAGVEWTVAKLLSLRAGYSTDTTRELSGDRLSGVTAGVGIHLAGQEFDYAWVPMGELGDTQYFSLLFQWGSAKPKALETKVAPPSSTKQSAPKATVKPAVDQRRNPHGEKPNKRRPDSDDDYYFLPGKTDSDLRMRGLHP